MTAFHTKKISAQLSPAERGARDRRIARAIKSGTSITDAARAHRLDTKTIRAICREQGVDLPGDAA